jgi:hypothetical protein
MIIEKTIIVLVELFFATAEIKNNAVSKVVRINSTGM